jgi:hypothetical protein
MASDCKKGQGSSWTLEEEDEEDIKICLEQNTRD